MKRMNDVDKGLHLTSESYSALACIDPKHMRTQMLLTLQRYRKQVATAAVFVHNSRAGVQKAFVNCDT